MVSVARRGWMVLGVLLLALAAVGRAAGDGPAKKRKGGEKEPTEEQLRAAEAIGNGHSYQKHVVDGKEFPKVKTREEFIKEIARVLANPSDSKKLTRGREAFYDEKANVLVIIDPRSKDEGTCFRPSAGKKYYDNLR